MIENIACGQVRLKTGGGISVTENMAYGQVNLEPGGGECEDLDKIKSDQGNSELMQHSADDECSGDEQVEAVYITAEDTSR